MSKNLVIGGGVVIAVLLVVVLFAFPAMTNDLNGSMSVQFYNGDEPVGAPTVFSFSRDGGEIDRFTVTLGWAATGETEGLETTLNVDGTVTLALETFSKTYELYWNVIDTDIKSGWTVDGSLLFTFMLADYPELDPTVQTSWKLQIVGLLEGSMTDSTGTRQTDSWTKTGTAEISWDAGAAPETFKLNAYWDF